MRRGFIALHLLSVAAISFTIGHSPYSCLNKSSFKDSWGFRYNWTDLEDGWNYEKKILAVEYKLSLAQRQNDVPKFTKSGYKKMTIPKELYNLIMKARNESQLTPEHCDMPNPYNNCYRIKVKHHVPFVNRTRTELGTFSFWRV